MFNALKRLITANPMGMFIYSLLGKWYLIIAFTSVVVTYWVFKGLKEIGFLDAAQKIVVEALNDSKSIAKNCILLLEDKDNPIENFWGCVQKPPRYIPDEPHPDEEDIKEKAIDSKINKILKKLENDHHSDPYKDLED